MSNAMFSSACVCISMKPHTGLAGATPPLISSKFSKKGTFLGTYSSNWCQKPHNKIHESYQSAKKKKKCWDPPQLQQEIAGSITAWLEVSPGALWQMIKWPLQPMSLASSVQITVLSPSLPPHHASRRKFKSHPQTLQNKVWHSSEKSIFMGFLK